MKRVHESVNCAKSTLHFFQTISNGKETPTILFKHENQNREIVEAFLCDLFHLIESLEGLERDELIKNARFQFEQGQHLAPLMEDLAKLACKRSQ